MGRKNEETKKEEKQQSEVPDKENPLKKYVIY